MTGASHAAGQAHPCPEASALLEMIGASWMSQAICVAAELGIADALGCGPMPVNDLARETGCQPESLYRLMRSLASLGIVTEREDAEFALTELGAMLSPAAPYSVHSWAIWWGRHLWPVFEHLRFSVKTGISARTMLTGSRGYGHLADTPEVAAIFNTAMAELTQIVAAEVLAAYDFSRVTRVVDIGGGYGELLKAILVANPAMHGVLFDLPHAMEEAGAKLRAAGLSGRHEMVSGNFFESVPQGADLYLLKSILHNWDDAQCSAILGNCRRAMAATARLVLVERVVPSPITGSRSDRAVVRTDLNMLVGLGGRERTVAEIEHLLNASGFELSRVLPTSLEFSIIECTPR